MKKFLLISALVAACAAVLAQAPFTIRRPVEGSKVRESVKIRIPKNSVPQGGYLGIYVNGKFVEAAATILATEAGSQTNPLGANNYVYLSGNDLVYELDTKKRGLADGPVKIEVVLFVDYAEGSRIIDRSSVNVVVDNSTSIAVPDNGFALRYSFVPGRVRHYQLGISRSMSMISEALARVGGRAAERTSSVLDFRFQYETLTAYNTKNGREGLVKVQPVPQKGKNYEVLQGEGEAEPRRYMDWELAPVYTRMTNVGREVFSAAPNYTPLEGSAGESSISDFYLFYPMPILPQRRVKPGDVWAAGIAVDNIALPLKDKIDDYFANVDARGVFEKVEWHRGVPCAKLRYVTSRGSEDLETMTNLNQIEGDAQRLEMEEIVWFALDRGEVITHQTSYTQESIVEVGGGQGGGQGNAGGGRGGSRFTPGAAGTSSAGGNSGSGGAAAPGIGFHFNPTFDEKGRLWFFQPGPSRAGGGQGPGLPGGRGGGGAQPAAAGAGDTGGFGNRGGGSSGGTRQVLRVRETWRSELEL